MKSEIKRIYKKSVISLNELNMENRTKLFTKLLIELFQKSFSEFYFYNFFSLPSLPQNWFFQWLTLLKVW